MANLEMKLNEGWAEDGFVPTRNGFGEGLKEAADNDERVVGVCADLTESTRMLALKDSHPDRFIQIGVSEQLLVAMGAGLAMAGKIPFIASYAMFCPGRAWEQVRTNLCLNDVNVKIAGSHAGVTVGPDGATHQALEDIAIMRCIPNMTLVVPCDYLQTKKATLALAKSDGPAYLRFSREKSAVLTTDDTPFEIGKAQVFKDGKDAAIIACGSLVAHATEAAEELSKEGIDCLVLNNHTIRPMDEEAVVAAAEKCGTVVTVEEHQIHGGMGSAVAEVLSRKLPTPIEYVGVDDKFGQSGKPEELISHYGLDKDSIKDAVKRAISRKS
jgi:transketolase